MKKIFFVSALAVSLIVLSSCSDFLDQLSPSELNNSSVYNSTYYTGIRVNKIYGGLEQDRTYAQDLAILYGLNSDCELVDGLGDNATANSERGAMNYNVTTGYTKLNDVWTALYGVIEDCNDVIEGVEGSPLIKESGSDKTEMERYLGEALTIRALLYLDLIRIWGDVPMKFETSQPDLSNAYMEKTDRDVIMDSLLNDLDKAIEYLPWADGVTGYTTERVTKGYAYGLYAQIALTRAGYAIRESAKSGYETASEYSDPTYPTQRPDAATRKTLYEKALTHLSAIIESGVHSLNPSFENEWYLVNQLSLDQTYHENLYEIPMGLGVTGELGYTVGVRLNTTTSDYGYTNSSGKLKVTAPLLYSYDENDTRRDITCANFQIVGRDGAGTKSQEQLLGNAPFGIYVGKWDVRKMSDAWLTQNLAATAKQGTGVNPILMRYSQVLLYYAECMNELAGPDGSYTGDAGLTARQALALVHVRAFDEEYKAQAQAYVDAISNDDFFNAIVDENAWELAGEGARKWDLIRWHLLIPKIIEFKQNYLTELYDGTYQETLYYNYTDDTQTTIDTKSITYYGIPNGMKSSDYDASNSSFGKENDTQLNTNLPSISSGLIGTDVDNPLSGVDVINRYIFPIGETTMSASNGTLKNSYGY
ncbi:MAG: RagB/SusD family nutrient uptake outer membrane protein [Prevotella sp.]|nr:RagB/SusD family nutrient uptake outer membrane protein [Prevotella sp.]